MISLSSQKKATEKLSPYATCAYPFKLKSGADRAGIMSFLFKVLYKKDDPEIAKKQLSLKYLHIKHAKTGILDAFCDLYISYYKSNENPDFLYWVRNIYNPDKLEKNFKENKLIEKLISNILKRE